MNRTTVPDNSGHVPKGTGDRQPLPLRGCPQPLSLELRERRDHTARRQGDRYRLSSSSPQDSETHGTAPRHAEACCDVRQRPAGSWTPAQRLSGEGAVMENTPHVADRTPEPGSLQRSLQPDAPAAATVTREPEGGRLSPIQESLSAGLEAAGRRRRGRSVCQCAGSGRRSVPALRGFSELHIITKVNESGSELNGDSV